MLIVVFIEFVLVIWFILYQFWSLNIVYQDYIKNMDTISTISIVKHYESVVKGFYEKTPDTDVFELAMQINNKNCVIDNNSNSNTDDPIDGCVITLEKINNSLLSTWNFDPFFIWKTDSTIFPSMEQLQNALIPRTFLTIKKEDDKYILNVMRKRWLQLDKDTPANSDPYKSLWNFSLIKQ